MKPSTNRAIRAQKTRQLLLDTALEMFGKKGFDNVTIDEIAKKCGVSKGAFYTHFNSKYDVFAVKFKDIDQFYEGFPNKISACCSTKEKIIVAYQEQMTYLRDEIGLEFLRTVYSSALSETMTENHYLIDPERKIYKLIETFLDEGLAKGEFKDVWQKDVLLLNLTRCMRATVFDWIIFQKKLDIVEEVTTLVTMLFEGIGISHTQEDIAK